jgi:ribosomal protein S18 acetylase RimI-like enzyme
VSGVIQGELGKRPRPAVGHLVARFFLNHAFTWLGIRLSRMDPRVRIAQLPDTRAVGELLHRFNTEFNEPTPTPEALAQRMVQLISSGDTVVLLAENEPSGIAVLRFRPAIWSSGLECYLAELYVIPERRRRGLGRALMLTAIEVAKGRGADAMDLGSDEGDHAAHALYRSLGFSNRGGPKGEISYFFEREL